MATNILDDNEIQIQLENFNMQDGFDFLKSLSGETVREKEEKIREKFPNSCKGQGNFYFKVS